MMISNADFQDLFPDIFAKESGAGKRAAVKAPSNSDAAGRKSSGSRLVPVVAPNNAGHQLPPRVGGAGPDLRRTAAPWALTPNMAAAGAAWLMLAGSGFFPRSRAL